MTFSIFRSASLICIFFLLARGVNAAAPSTRPSLFDPARHMRISEVRPGMKGYGLSVFMGTRIERFDVEVISILKNFNPKDDVVLIRFGGDNLEHNLAIEGMSGSPIYLYDNTGKARMIGAFAYGWLLPKDPIAGVQPIEYMLELPRSTAAATSRPDDDGSDTMQTLPLLHSAWSIAGAPIKDAAQSVRPARWSLWDTSLLPSMKPTQTNHPLPKWGQLLVDRQLFSTDDQPRALVPLATPLMIGGVSPRVLHEMEPMLRAYGLIPLQAGGSGGSTDGPDPVIEPGSVLGIPLVQGDIDISAVGTCTEVIGNQVLAFGHSFNAEGRVSLPLAGGSVQGIVAGLSSSFKLGALGRVRGTLQNDQTVGVAGELGTGPGTVPVDLRVRYTDGSQDQMYHFTVARHPKMTPMLVAAAMSSAITGAKEMPENHTVDYDLALNFNNGKVLHVLNSSVNISAADLFSEVGTPLTAAVDNPFQVVMVKKITGTLVVSPVARQGDILYANVPRSRYRPGETVNAFVTFRPFRADEMTMPVSMELPRDLPDGTYQLTISDWQKYFNDERTAEPFKFTAENIDQVFDVLQAAVGIRHDALYLRLIRQSDGVAIGPTAMPRLPSSRRQILMGAGRSDTTQYVSSSVKVIPTDRVMTGSADFVITIDKNADDLNAK